MTADEMKRPIRGDRMSSTADSGTTARGAAPATIAPDAVDDHTYRRLIAAWREASHGLNRWRSRTVATGNGGEPTVIGSPRALPDRDDVAAFVAATGGPDTAAAAIRAGYEDAGLASEFVAAVSRFVSSVGSVCSTNPVSVTLADFDLITGRWANIAVDDPDTGETVPLTVAHQRGLLGAGEVVACALAARRDAACSVAARLRQQLEPTVDELLVQAVLAEVHRRDDLDGLDFDGDVEAWTDRLVDTLHGKIHQQIHQHTTDTRGLAGTVYRTSWPDPDTAAAVAKRGTDAALGPLSDAFQRAVAADPAYDAAAMFAHLAYHGSQQADPWLIDRLRREASRLAATRR